VDVDAVLVLSARNRACRLLGLHAGEAFDESDGGSAEAVSSAAALAAAGSGDE
jgi:hypothetical protein